MPYTDPGYAVASTLEDILTKRKAEARQARLDALHEEQVRASLAIQKENAESNKMYRDAWADERRQNAATKFKAGLSKGQPLDPNDPTYGGMLTTADIVPGVDPEKNAVVGPQGLEQGSKIFGMTSNVSGKDAADFLDAASTTGVKSIAPIVKPPTFYGTPKEIEEDKKREAMRAYANKLAPDHPLRMAIEYNLATGGDNPPAASITPPKPTNETMVFIKRDGTAMINGKVVDASKIPAGAHYQYEGLDRAPRVVPEHTYGAIEIDDPDHPGHKIPAAWDPKDPTKAPVPLPQGFRKPPTGANSNKIEAVIPSNLGTALTKANAEVAKYTGRFAPTAAKAQAEAQRKLVLDQIFALHPTLAPAVRAMASNPAAASFTFDQLVAGIKPQPNDTDKEAMRALYTALTGRQ